MKDPAFLFYPGDWLGGTIGMTFEEKGAYLELLMVQFNRGHMTDHMCGQVVGQLWDKVKCKFQQDSDGLWFNERLDIEKQRRKRFVESRKNNKEGKNQFDKSGHMTSHMENRNRNESINTDIIQIGELNKKIYILIVPKTIGNKYRINGEEGLKEYFDQQGSILSRPEYAKKFILERTGKIYSDFMHVWNDFNQFVNNQFKR